MLFLKLTPDRIMTRIGYIGQPVDHSQCKQDGGIISESSRRISLLDPVKGHPADRGSFRENGDRYATPSTGVANVPAELAQSTEDRYGRCRRFLSRFAAIVHYREPYVI
jgi:hypothetical protein